MNILSHSTSTGTVWPSVQSATVTAFQQVGGQPLVRPEFFPMPQRGSDPHFGLCRTSYFDLERAGLVRLVRVRKPGNLRGKVLIPYEAVRALLIKLNQRA